jgi:hypothetical protein
MMSLGAFVIGASMLVAGLAVWFIRDPEDYS